MVRYRGVRGSEVIATPMASCREEVLLRTCACSGGIGINNWWGLAEEGDPARDDESSPELLPSGTRVREYDCVELLGPSSEASRSIDFVNANESA